MPAANGTDEITIEQTEAELRSLLALIKRPVDDEEVSNIVQRLSNLIEDHRENLTVDTIAQLSRLSGMIQIRPFVGLKQAPAVLEQAIDELDTMRRIKEALKTKTKA